jgi:hypothetical protein
MFPFCRLVSPPEPPVPIRLFEPEAVPGPPREPPMSLGVPFTVLRATIVSLSAAVAPKYRPPAEDLAELPLMVTFVSVATPP